MKMENADHMLICIKNYYTLSCDTLQYYNYLSIFLIATEALYDFFLYHHP